MFWEYFKKVMIQKDLDRRWGPITNGTVRDRTTMFEIMGNRPISYGNVRGLQNSPIADVTVHGQTESPEIGLSLPELDRTDHKNSNRKV